MKTGGIALCLLVLVLSVYAHHDEPNPTPFTAGNQVTATIFPCNHHYWYTTGFQGSAVGTYARIDFNWTSYQVADDPTIWVGAGFIPTERQWTDTCTLNTPATGCTFYDICRVPGNTAYVTVDGGHRDAASYAFTVASRSTNPTNLGTITGNTATKSLYTRANNQDLKFEPPQYYDHYYLATPTYQPGMYLVVNITKVASNVTTSWPSLYVNWNGLATVETNCVSTGCLSSTDNTGSCTCSSDASTDNCGVVVRPCAFAKNGTYFFSVLIPENTRVNYTISAAYYYPYVLQLTNGVTYQYTADGGRSGHHVLKVNASQITNSSRLRVTVNNVVGGGVNIYVQKGELAGGKDGCHTAIRTCTTSWACDIYVPSCVFGAGDWYVAVDAAATTNYRLPLSYSIQATIVPEPGVLALTPGDVIVTSIKENDYHFYSVDIPNTANTWLYAELYLNRNDSEVWFSMHPGSIVGPAGYCYPEPPADNWTCSTGGDSNNREACYFHLQTCYLQPGTVYFTVWQKNYTAYGHPLTKYNTFYAIPTEYTLRITLDQPRMVLNNISYSEHVYANHYQHYYLPIDNVVTGEHLTVHFANVQRGTITGYVYLNDLAGECPCYKNIRNCTASAPGGWCDLQIDTCLFQSGVWYISARGWPVADNAVVPIGYTLTVIRNPAPPIWDLTLDNTIWNTMGWNESHHYKLPVPSSSYTDNLVIKIILDQDQGKAYQLHNLVAYNKFPSWYEDYWTHHCYEEYCFTNVGSNSYCTIRIRACDWNALVRGGDWYLSVYGTGWNQNDPRALYTIRTFLEADPVQALVSGAPVYDKVQNFGWRHYYLDLTNGTGANNMFVEIYTNNDQDLVTFRMNVNNVAGVIYDTNPSWSPCTNYLKPYECNTTTSCAWQIQNCILQPAIYYFSVYGLSKRWEDPRYAQQYYDIPVEYTLTVTLVSQVETLNYEYPVAGYLVKGGLNQYQITIPTLNYTNNGFQYFVLETANARHGTVKTYVRHGPTGAKLAGPCPCYEWDWRYDTADNGAVGSLILPYCWLKGNEGLYTIAVEDITPDTDAGRTSTTLDLTPTAYTLTASLITPTMQTNYTVGSTVTGHVLGNNRYWHYQLNGLSTATLPQQLQIFVYNVKNGAVTVYLNPTYGAAVGTASDCAAWTAGSCSGTQCQWYVPECIWGTNGTWWLSVKGSASLNVTYDLGTKLVTPTTLGSVTWFNQINQYGFADQYKFTVASSNNNPYIVVDITNATAALNVYVNSQSMAGSNACKSCVHTVSYDNSASTTTLCSAGTCKFRIPSCSTKAGDWYIVVAPVVAAATNYSIKWAQYDSSASNTPVSTFTPATITLSKIESWQMFSVPITNAAATPSQLIISATWGTGSASVKMYVNHTNLVGGSTCGDWVCDSDSSPSGCTFTLDSCCVQSTTYRFGFFQTSEGTRDITYNVQQWSEHGTSALTIGTSGYTTTTDSEGVAESTYRFFRMNIPNTVITSSQTVYLNISILSQTSAGALQVYLRPNYQAGQLGRCYDSVATATATFASPAIIELQGCLLSNTDWYIGLYNPATQVSKPGDSKPVYFSAWASTYSPIAANVGANAWINATVDSTNVLAAQSWVHFSFNVDASSISYNKNSLKVEIIPLVGTISTLYLNYGSLAGSNITLGNIACAGNCFSSAAPTLSITVPSCTLRSGTWYAAAKVAGSTTQYAFRAQIVSQNYVALGAPTQVGTDPLAYRYNLIQQSLTNPAVAGTQFVYYSFSITSDMIRPTTKLSINVTDVSSGTVQVSVYKDCSLQWTVSTVSSAVIADKTKMGPCDLQAGEYLIVVQADAVPAVTGWYANYTVAVFLRDATNYTLDMTGLVGRDHDHVFTNYHDVWNINVPQLTNANQTLAINFNVSCGAITAYLNYGTPGGPGCNIASCSSSMTTGTNPSTRYDTTCTMFLDTCQVQPGVYYVTVVGAGQEFTSQYLYQQVNYEIWATPTYYNYTAIAPDTWYGYTGAIKTNASTAYVANQLTNDWRQYWYVDEETSNPGSRLKFTLYGNTSDSLYVAYENAFGAVNGASNAKCTAPSSCTIASGATTCTVTINSCALKIGRYFLLAKVASYPANWYWDRVRAWRQEVDIPYLWPGQAVTGTVGDDYPQYYKILVINPSDTEFYGDFRVYNVDLGSVTATLSHVIYGSQTPGQQAGCLSSTGKTACTAALNSNCSVHIAPCYAFANLTYFLEIDAATHDNANRSVRYSLVYTLRPPVMSLPLNTRVCDTVHLNEYRHWKLSPQASNLEDILLVNITTLYSPETVSLSLNDYPNRLGVEDGSTNSYGQCWRNYWSGASPDTVTSTGLTTYYECAYTDFHIGVRGKTVNDNLIGIKYLIEARVNPAPVITLTLGTPAYYCASNRYYFKVTVPANVTFFEVLVSTEDTSKSATVWVKQGSLAAPNCYDKTATGAGLIGTWNIQTCGLPAGVYYITVSSPNTPFVITAKTSNKAITQVGNSTAVTGTAMVSTADVDATVPIYSINVTSTQIATTNTPQLDFWLTYNTANGGLAISNIYFGSTNGTAASTCDVAFTVTRVTQSTWKYTVKNCYLRAGTYYAFLKSTSTDCLVAPSYALKSGTVSYSLTAAVTQTIAPTPIPLNVVQNNTIQSNVVQHYYINGTQSSGRFLYVRIFNVPTAYPLTVTWSLFKPVDPTATGCVNAGTTSRTNDWTGFKYYATNTVIGSEVFRIDTCNYTPTDKVYFAISSSNADGCTNQPFGISYNFVVYETQWTPLTALSTTTETINDNRELRFYSISTSSMQAVTVRVTPTTADGKVSISVQDNECDTSKYIEYQWTKDCVPGQYCDIEIPTRAAHPEKGKNTFYIIVKSNRANYTITWFAGTQNCGNPSFTSTSFCGTDVVNYATWNWNNNWQALDTQARGLFEKLYLDFHYSRDFPCYVNCNTSLRQYACHETFRMCDTAGFITPVCKASCDHVVYYCQNWFDTVQVREMNCTSHQYGDAYYGNCTGLDVKVPYPPNSFVNIQGAVAGASLLAPSVLVLLALLALYLL